MSMKDAARAIFPPDLKPLQRWRLTMAGVVMVLCVFLLWSLGAFAPFGFGEGFARAADTKELKELTKNVQANTRQIAEVANAQSAQSEDVTDLMKEVISQRIRQAISARCRLPGERERINREIELMQQQYLKRAGTRYPEPPCEAL